MDPGPRRVASLIRPLFDPADFDVLGEAEERAKRFGEELDKESLIVVDALRYRTTARR